MVRGCVGVAGEAGVEAGEPAADVRFDLRLGAAGGLEVADVELLLASDAREAVGGAGASLGAYGTLSSPTAVKTSGRSRALFAAIGEPQSCPTTVAVSSPRAWTTAVLSATWASMR